MVLGCEEDGSDCAHAPAPHCQPLYLQVLVGLSKDGLCVSRLIQAIGEEAHVAVAASHEIEGDNCYSMFGNEGQHAQDLDLAASIAVEVEECVLDGAVLLAEDDSADVATVISGHAEVQSLDELTIH